MSARELGAVQTPLAVARAIAQRAVGEVAAGRSAEQIARLRVLEPSAGEGAFLVALAEALETAWLAAGGAPWRRRRYRAHLVGHQLFARELDPARLERARARLTEWAGEAPSAAACRAGDALIEPWPRGIDIVAGNPPWVSARTDKERGADRIRLRTTAGLRAARGAFDLASAFTELALGALAPGGVLAFLVPRALLSTTSAQPLRELLLGTTTVTALDESVAAGAFPDVEVYPLLIIARARPSRPGDRVLLGDRTSMAHAELQAAGFPLAGVGARSARGVALDTMANVFAGTAGFEAARTAAALREAGGDSSPQGVPFVTSALVRTFRIAVAPVRFQRRVWRAPLLVDGQASRRARDRTPKILVAGMARELRAAWCPYPVAGAIGVLGVVPRPGVDPFLLLGCLNAASTARDYAARFPGKRMAGEYLAVNAHTLRAVPIVSLESPAAAGIAHLACTLHAEPGDTAARRELDRLVAHALDLP